MAFQPVTPEAVRQVIQHSRERPPAHKKRGFVSWLKNQAIRADGALNNALYRLSPFTRRIAEKRQERYIKNNIDTVKQALSGYARQLATDGLRHPSEWKPIPDEDVKLFVDSGKMEMRRMYPNKFTLESLHHFQQALNAGEAYSPSSPPSETPIPQEIERTVMDPLSQEVLHLGKYHSMSEFRPQSSAEALNEVDAQEALVTFWDQPLPLDPVQKTLGHSYDLFCAGDIFEQIAQDSPEKMRQILTNQMNCGKEGFTIAQTIVMDIFRVPIIENYERARGVGPMQKDFAFTLKHLLGSPIPKEAIENSIVEAREKNKPFTLGLLISQMASIKKPDYYRNLVYAVSENMAVNHLINDFLDNRVGRLELFKTT